MRREYVAPHGRVALVKRGEHGDLVRYLTGWLKGREARIPREHLRAVRGKK